MGASTCCCRSGGAGGLRIGNAGEASNTGGRSSGGWVLPADIMEAVLAMQGEQEGEQEEGEPHPDGQPEAAMEPYQATAVPPDLDTLFPEPTGYLGHGTGGGASWGHGGRAW